MQHSGVTKLIPAMMLVLCVAFFAADCKKIVPETPDNPVTPDNPDNPDKPDNPGSDYFRLVTIYDSSKEPDKLNIFSYGPVEYSLVAQTNLKADKLSIVSDADWCKCSYEGNILKIKLSQYGEENEVLQPRSCKVEVKAGTVYHGSFNFV